MARAWPAFLAMGTWMLAGIRAESFVLDLERDSAHVDPSKVTAHFVGGACAEGSVSAERVVCDGAPLADLPAVTTSVLTCPSKAWSVQVHVEGCSEEIDKTDIVAAVRDPLPQFVVSQDVPASVDVRETFTVGLELVGQAEAVSVSPRFSPADSCSVGGTWLWKQEDGRKTQTFWCKSPGTHQLCFDTAQAVIPCRIFVVEAGPQYLVLIPSMILPFACFAVLGCIACLGFRSPTDRPDEAGEVSPHEHSPHRYQYHHAAAHSPSFVMSNAHAPQPVSFTQPFLAEEVVGPFGRHVTSPDVESQPLSPMIQNGATGNTPTSASLNRYPSFGRGLPLRSGSLQSGMKGIRKTVSIVVEGDSGMGSSIYTPRRRYPSSPGRAVAGSRVPSMAQRVHDSAINAGDCSPVTCGSADFPEQDAGAQEASQSAIQERRALWKKKVSLENTSRGRPPVSPASMRPY
eukprot:TRINITY_DN6378_c0_g2_i1.p1 TRINITY_DN6378_c0_g2~~TRINITY_DN6378_c0_g2_i1.p1  ORF type:complete len:459 (+),score=76.78 TRINITY_DN6378_c0_g2_i1:54-1430(+)